MTHEPPVRPSAAHDRQLTQRITSPDEQLGLALQTRIIAPDHPLKLLKHQLSRAAVHVR